MIPTMKTKIKLIHTKFVVKRKNYNIYIYHPLPLKMDEDSFPPH